MKGKRLYVRGNVGSRQYVGHMTESEAIRTLDSFEEVSKAEYQAARADGVQSWSEYETQCKREGRKPLKSVTWKW